jgi:hypothetical protein
MRQAFFIGPLTSPRVLRALGVLFLAIWTAAFVVHELSTPGLVDRKGIAVGRDLIAFYAAGRIVSNGEGRALYDTRLQRRVQAAIVAPQVQQGYCYYISPPFVAVLYAPLAALPYRLAHFLHVLVMLVCFVAGMWALRRQMPGIAPAHLTAVLVGCSWFPMMQTILGGQNAALTFLLLSLAYVATVRNRRWRAGLALGLQLFKPQFALPLLGLLLLKGHAATVGAALAVAAVAYLVGAAGSGWGWPIQMARVVRGAYRELERVANGHKHIALPEVLDYSVAQPLEARGHGWARPAMAATGLAGVAALAAYLVVRWRDADSRRPDFGLYWALASALSLLASLHTQYYDAALLVLPVLLVLDYHVRVGLEVGSWTRVLLVVGYLVFPLLQLLEVSPRIGVQTWVVLPAAVAWWIARTLRRARGNGSTVLEE